MPGTHVAPFKQGLEAQAWKGSVVRTKTDGVTGMVEGVEAVAVILETVPLKVSKV
jgi:hypothetical protein